VGDVVWWAVAAAVVEAVGLVVLSVLLTRSRRGAADLRRRLNARQRPGSGENRLGNRELGVFARRGSSPGLRTDVCLAGVARADLATSSSSRLLTPSAPRVSTIEVDGDGFYGAAARRHSILVTC